MGPCGSGKSTLLSAVLGEVPVVFASGGATSGANGGAISGANSGASGGSLVDAREGVQLWPGCTVLPDSGSATYITLGGGGYTSASGGRVEGAARGGVKVGYVSQQVSRYAEVNI